jgi:hypothetical protein
MKKFHPRFGISSIGIALITIGIIILSLVAGSYYLAPYLGITTTSTVLHPSLPALLRVQSNPALPTTISVDGIARNNIAINSLPLNQGNHSISFTDVPGYQRPSYYAVTLEGRVSGSKLIPISSPVPLYYNTTTIVEINFTQEGLLQVVTNPSTSAIIYLNGTALDMGSANVSLIPGNYIVSFGNASGLITPSPQPVSIRAGQIVTVQGNYSAGGSFFEQGQNIGWLKVQSNPPLRTTISLNGLHVDDWGVDRLPVVRGKYSLQFTDVSYYKSPTSYSVTFVSLSGNQTGPTKIPISSSIPVYVNTTTVVTIDFQQEGLLQVATNPPVDAIIYVNGTAMDPWDLSVSLPPANYTVTFGSVSNLRTPSSVSVQLPSGVSALVSGNYSSGSRSISVLGLAMSFAQIRSFYDLIIMQSFILISTRSCRSFCKSPANRLWGRFGQVLKFIQVSDKS